MPAPRTPGSLRDSLIRLALRSGLIDSNGLTDSNRPVDLTGSNDCNQPD